MMRERLAGGKTGWVSKGRAARGGWFARAALLATFVLAGCSSADPVAPPVPDTVTIAVPTSVLTVGEIGFLQARVAVAGGGVPSANVVWTSSAPNVLSVAPGGVLTAMSRGKAEITAAMASNPNVKSSVALSVVGASALRLDTRTVALAEGTQRRLAATVTYDEGATATPVVWRSTFPAVALVDNHGMITALTAGTTIIRATAAGQADSAVITVSPQAVGSVSIDSASSAALFIGDRRTLTVTVRNPAGVNLSGRTITWTSANPLVATVSSAGIVSAVGAGTTVISAESGGRIAEANVVVIERASSITLAPAAIRVPRGRTEPLSAVIRNAAGTILTDRRAVTWRTSAPTIATVDADGTVTGVANGTASVTATVDGMSGVAAITVVDPVAAVLVTPAIVNLSSGMTQQMTAAARDAKGGAVTGRPVLWTSSNPAVVSIGASGVVTAVSPGSAVITATVEGVDATATVTVLRPVASVSFTSLQSSLFIGRTMQLSVSARDAQGVTLTGRTVTWRSSDPAIATISTTGLVTAIATGPVTITANVEGVEANASLTMVALPPALTAIRASVDTVVLYQGQRAAVTATVTQPTGAPTATITYGTVMPSVATVANDGVISAVGPGTARITVTAAVAGNVNFSAATQSTIVAVIVRPLPVASAQITPGNANLVVGGTQQLATVVRDSLGNVLTERTARWASSNSAVATVSATGLVTAVAVGSATVTVTVEGATATALLSVGPLPPAITSLTVSPTAVSLIASQTRTLTPVLVRPTGAAAASVTYGSADPSVATVTSAGVITALSTGTAIITVTATAAGNTTYAAATLTELVTVTVAPAVASVQVTPGSVSIMPGSTQQLTTTVRDSSGADLTGRAITWTTSNSAIATVTATGLVTAVAVGTATITATAGGVTGTMTMTVLALPTSITAVSVTPTSVSLAVGRSSALSPVVTQPNGAPAATVTFGTTAPAVATVSSAGLIIAVGPGTATITVTASSAGNTGFSAASRTTTVTVSVTDVPVATVSVAPANASVLTGSTQPLTVTVRDSAGQALTGRTVSWATLNASVATVNSTGVVTGVSAGTVTINATVDGIVGSATITVQTPPPGITTLSVSPTSATVTVGQTRTLTSTVTQPTGAPVAGVSYSTSNPAIATVSPTGVVSAVAAGSVTITVTATSAGTASFSNTTVTSNVTISVVP
ncbi:beta strand repeat-containing protein [Gemmatimonas sp.]|uniref:beta strand repeat-containing protein n=1 Tax=Gemmatimonas sp. TaxID=1962908 RepID=UPI003F72EF9A